jgi:hypothetical protein
VDFLGEVRKERQGLEEGDNVRERREEGQGG